MRDDLLRAQSDQRGVFGRQRQSFVERICVQRLAPAEHGRERLNGHAHDVVFGLLCRERRAGRLRVKAQQQRARVARSKPLAHDVRPEAPRGAVLGDLFEQVVVRVEEERELRRELIHVQARLQRGLHVRDGVPQRERHFLHRRRAGLANVVAGNRNRVPLGQFAVAPGKNVRHNAHCRSERINVRAPRDIFLQDVVLDRAAQLPQVRALLFCHCRIEAQQDRRRRVDGHGGGDFLQRNPLKESFHVLERVDGYTDFADFAVREGRVGIQSDLRGQVERHREPYLPLAQEVAIAAVRFRRGAEPGILPRGPQAPAIHRRIDAARVGEFAGIAQRFFGVPAWQALCGIEPLHR